MKKNLFCSIVFIFFVSLIYSQNIKSKFPSFRYEVLPSKPLTPEYKTYHVEVLNGGNDNIPLSSKFIFIRSDFITGLENISVVNVQTGFIHGGEITGKIVKVGNSKGLESNIQIKVVFKTIELTDKKLEQNVVKNQTTGANENFMSYRLQFKFAYVLQIIDLIKNQFILDTLIDNPRFTSYPYNYKFDGYGNRMELRGYPNQPALDLDYNKNEGTLYADSKMAISETCMNEVKAIANSYLGYTNSYYSIMITKVKSKNPLFDKTDTALKKIEDVFDFTNDNTKQKKHLNWHTQAMRNKAKDATTIWEAMIADQSILKEFKKAEDADEFILKMKRNLIVGYMLQDEFDTALKYYDEIFPLTRVKFLGEEVDDNTMKELYGLIFRERTNYLVHKAFFHFE